METHKKIWKNVEEEVQKIKAKIKALKYGIKFTDSNVDLYNNN